MILITGGSKCGKSVLAERLLEGCAEKIYIATMRPYGEEALRAIERHRKTRAGKGFVTVEKYTDIDELETGHGYADIDGLKAGQVFGAKAEPCVGSVCGGRGVLLECMGNLLANEMFREERRADISGHILKGVAKLAGGCDRLVIVTNDVAGDGGRYPESTREYIRLLGMINRELAGMAEEVIECVYGIPVVLKGGGSWLCRNQSRV